MLICIVIFIQDTGEMFTRLTGIKWYCNLRRDQVLKFVLFPIYGLS